jgi:F420H(2)-dependent quinone reductase
MAMAGKTERASPFTVLAEELDSTARAELRPELVAWAPDLSEFQARTARQIPVFMLTCQD